jgi:hypothetical protein
MTRLSIVLTILLVFQISCKSDDEDCPEVYYSHDQPAMYLPVYEYIYATETTEHACYEHGLAVIASRNAYKPDHNKDECGIYTLEYRYQKQYRMDTIAEKFFQDFENLNATEIEGLTNLICGRKNGFEQFEMQSLDSFEFINGEVHVEFTINDKSQSRIINSYLDDGFNCPLYSFNCYSNFVED